MCRYVLSIPLLADRRSKRLHCPLSASGLLSRLVINLIAATRVLHLRCWFAPASIFDSFHRHPKLYSNTICLLQFCYNGLSMSDICNTTLCMIRITPFNSRPHSYHKWCRLWRYGHETANYINIEPANAMSRGKSGALASLNFLFYRCASCGTSSCNNVYACRASPCMA